jgi:hypothetical protein
MIWFTDFNKAFQNVVFKYIYTRKTSAAFPVPFITKFTNAHWQYAQLCCRAFHPSQAISVASTGRSLLCL